MSHADPRYFGESPQGATWPASSPQRILLLLVGPHTCLSARKRFPSGDRAGCRVNPTRLPAPRSRGRAGIADWVGVLLVLVVELLNSSVEAAVDRIGFDTHRLSKRAKDLGSAAVLLALAALLITWVLLAVPVVIRLTAS